MEKSTDEHLMWALVSEKHIVNNRWIDFREEIWRLPDGRPLGPFYSYSRCSYVVVVATTEEGNYLCVRQFRQGIREVTMEFPAGGIEDGEDPLEAAKRELKEETGHVSGKWKLISKVPSSATISGNYAYIFRAEGCFKKGKRHLDSTEFVDIVALSPGELRDIIKNDGFAQAVHVMAYYRALDD